MNIKMSLIVALALIFGGGIPVPAQTNEPSTNPAVLYYTCPMHPSVKSDKPGSCPICGMTLEAVYATDATTNSVPSGPINAKPTPYPLKTCVVSGETLGEMGEPIVFVYTNNGANQEIKFCCPDCKSKFLKDPDKYMKTIKVAEGKK